MTTTVTIGVAKRDSLPSERDRQTLVARNYLHLLEPDWPSIPSSTSQLYNTILACLPASSSGLAKYLPGLRRPAPGDNPLDTRPGPTLQALSIGTCPGGLEGHIGVDYLAGSHWESRLSPSPRFTHPARAHAASRSRP